MDDTGVEDTASGCVGAAGGLVNNPDTINEVSSSGPNDAANQILNGMAGAFSASSSRNANVGLSVAQNTLGATSQITSAISMAQAGSGGGNDLTFSNQLADIFSETSDNINSFVNGPVSKKRSFTSQCDRDFWLEPGTTLEGDASGATGFVSMRYKQDPFSVVAGQSANGGVGKQTETEYCVSTDNRFLS